MVKIKRAYDLPAIGDGYRILVDRLWPRGISKAKADIKLWFKEIAPTVPLRKWFGHDPKKWADFKKRYARELGTQNGQKAVKELRKIVRREKTVTLVYAAKDPEHNHALALKGLLKV
jgi:uncharacterized protein YeaO (DUF488 family)